MTPTAADDRESRLRRGAQLLVGVVAVVGVVHLGRDVTTLPERLLALRAWFGSETASESSPYAADDMLRQADRLLPREASVLLLTPGQDVRHAEYTAFHRALYWLTPRPVWWLTPAPSDGTWESRWWTSTPLSGADISREAKAKGATHLLLVDPTAPPPIGTRMADLAGGAIFVLPGDAVSQAGSGSADKGDRRPWLWMVRSLAALLTILVLGDALLFVMARIGLDTVAVERVALAWTIGAGATSIAMLWLNALGAALGPQVAIVSFVAAGSVVVRRRLRRENPEPPAHRGASSGAHGAIVARRGVGAVSIAIVATAVLIVALTAVGQPLTLWDSWVLWGMRARTMYVAGGVTPVIYADPSRAVTLLDYPLLFPLLEAWIYQWSGVADERLAGLIAVPFFAALPLIAYAALKRRGRDSNLAWLGAAAVVAIPALVGSAGAVMAEVAVALFATVAAIYLVDWLESRNAAALAVAALAAGFLPWTKREGAVLVAVLAAATLIVGRLRRDACIAAAAIMVSAALLSGPWYVFAAGYGVNRPPFEALSPSQLLSNVDRLPSIVWRALGALMSPASGWGWFAAGVFVLAYRPAGAARRASALLPLAGGLYVLTMAGTYLFSTYVPYQQHIVSSFPRLVAEVAVLPVLWIAYHATPKP